jgi:LmbE family N-acetylglucosaminyl deacetylase
MANKKSILAVAAHPDDLEFACAITIKNFISEGYDTNYIIITNGENGFKEEGVRREERIKIRRREQLEAAQRLGIKRVYFLGYKDGFLEYSEKLRKKLTLLIKKLKPEIVFSFDPTNQAFDNLNLFHRDHRVAAAAVFDACFAAKNNFIYPSKTGLHRVEKLYFFGTDKPDYFTDITNEFDYKMEIIKCHRSQFRDFELFKDYFKKNLASYTDKFKYSEAFRKLEVQKVT